MDRTLTPSKLVLVEDYRRGSAPGRVRSEPVRRYRIARLSLEGRPAQSSGRFDYLKRVFD